MIFIIPLLFGALGAAVGAVAGAFTAHAAGEKDRQAAKHHRQVANELTDKYVSLEKKYYEFADESKRQINDITRQHALDEVEKDCLRLAVRLQQNLISLMWEIDREPTTDALNRFQGSVEETNQVLKQLKEELIIVPHDYYPRLLKRIDDTDIYKKLRNLLEQGKWEEADNETATLMFKLSGQIYKMSSEYAKTVPFTEFNTIDQLWNEYSNGRFGFSVQKRIWQEEYSKLSEFDSNKIYARFCETVGWRVINGCLLSSYLNFSLNAPVGHLPVKVAGQGWSAASFLGSMTHKTEENNTEEEILEKYEEIKYLLASGKWRQANQETRILMLKIAGTSEQSFLTTEDIENFPFQDLYNIDRCWVTYSKGRFGFSAQKTIWDGSFLHPSWNKDWQEFGRDVGWRRFDNSGWRVEHEIQFSLNAEDGHLPVIFPCGKESEDFSSNLVLSLLSKFKQGVEETQIKYEKLQHLLADGKWREANEETRTGMLKVAGRSQEGFFREEDIEQFPNQDLDTIDRLWSNYTDGHFGFSVQSDVWHKMGKDWYKFSASVGWGEYNYDLRKRFKWISKDELTFSLRTPKGHLPAVFPYVTEERGFSSRLVLSVLSKFEAEKVEPLTRLENLGIYQRLRRLLAAEKWREANHETRRVMLKLANRSQQGDFQVKDIDFLLCRDLYIIDKLWVTYSKGRFGFSLQKSIWQNVQEDWHEFGDCVEWGYYDEWDNFKWISKEEIIFSLNAPRGHLPAVFPCVTQFRGFSARVVWSVLSKFEFISN